MVWLLAGSAPTQAYLALIVAFGLLGSELHEYGHTTTGHALS